MGERTEWLAFECEISLNSLRHGGHQSPTVLIFFVCFVISHRHIGVRKFVHEH